ncbi:MAG TPA: hypothetical protein VEN12_11915 [Verrucomicrobiae bacterium]|nr:hypothetical protein [Verrucomicrobiae bacterium]
MKLLSAAFRPFIELWSREPVAISGLILAFVNLLIVFSVLHMSVQQIGAINMFLVAFFAFVARGAVTPIANPKDADGNRLVPQATWQRQRVKGE